MSKVNEKFLNSRLKKMYGDDFDPLMKMAENAYTMQKAIEAKFEEAIETGDAEKMPSADDLIDANREWERLAQFTSPKLKSVEHKGDNQVTEVHIHR